MSTPQARAQPTPRRFPRFEVPRSLRARVRARESSLIFLGGGIGAIAGLAVAAKSNKKSVHTTCRTNTSVLPPAGQTDISPPADNGTEYGAARCGKFGKGAQGDAFTLADSGFTFARFVWYLGTGTIHGKYELIPSPGATFTAEDFTGVLKVTGGTGALGSAMARGLAAAGARIGILARHEEPARLLAEQIGEAGGEAIPLPADVLQRPAIERCRATLLERW